MPSISSRRLRGVKSLPGNVRAYDVKWTPPESVSAGVDTTVIVVPRSDVTWVGISPDEKRLAALLADLLLKKSRTLAELP